MKVNSKKAKNEQLFLLIHLGRSLWISVRIADRGIPLECFYHFGEVHEGAVFIYYFLKGW